MVTTNSSEAPLALPTCSIRLTDLIGTKLSRYLVTLDLALLGGPSQLHLSLFRKPTGGHSLTSREVATGHTASPPNRCCRRELRGEQSVGYPSSTRKCLRCVQAYFRTWNYRVSLQFAPTL
ncbi:BQ5605_C001g00050 [Microbotryum silenes-dioicae]|uniref:BQ5605_C001g00050 protein n=1 Tax=Microbotryum silenes-dioicae TaxID=796604 RepID=A0A2X0M262_9BASI|nr:BQ5605_C001g00050 [Microbotryum silenes-dioicae]